MQVTLHHLNRKHLHYPSCGGESDPHTQASAFLGDPHLTLSETPPTCPSVYHTQSTCPPYTTVAISVLIYIHHLDRNH
jgi:hypothetical protein